MVLTADPGAAATQAVAQASEALGDLPPTLAVLFASAHFLGAAEALVAAIAEQAGPLPLIGCVGEAVAGGAREVESEPAVSLWLGAGLGPVETFAMEFIRGQTLRTAAAAVQRSGAGMARVQFHNRLP